MTNPPGDVRGLRRPGLPIDPMLQVAAGALLPVATVATLAGQWVRLAPADPMRVAVYVWADALAGTVAIGPDGMTITNLAGATPPSYPIVLHCRDYPGLVQAELFVQASTPGVVQWSAYTLSDLWG